VAGRPPEDVGVDVVHREISPGYHSVLNIPVIRGRAFDDADNANAPSVVLINDALAKKYFANDDPIGKRITFDRIPDSPVLADDRRCSRRRAAAGPRIQSRPEFFAPAVQDENGPAFVIRASVPPTSIIAAARSTLTGIDRNVAINRIRPMTEIRDAALAWRKFVMTLVLTFAAAGCSLALVGRLRVMAQLTVASP
jgi:putative ABC transport system permease protein